MFPFRGKSIKSKVFSGLQQFFFVYSEILANFAAANNI